MHTDCTHRPTHVNTTKTLSSNINKATRCKAKARHSKAKAKALGGKAKAKASGCKAKAKDFSFKAKAKILALRPKPWPKPKLAGAVICKLK